MFMYSVNRLSTALAGGCQTYSVRPCLLVRIFLFAVLSTVLRQNDNLTYSLHNKLINDSNLKAKFSKQVNLKSRFQDNVKFMQTLITCLFLSLLWIYFLILLSGDLQLLSKNFLDSVFCHNYLHTPVVLK